MKFKMQHSNPVLDAGRSHKQTPTLKLGNICEAAFVAVTRLKPVLTIVGKFSSCSEFWTEGVKICHWTEEHAWVEEASNKCNNYSNLEGIFWESSREDNQGGGQVSGKQRVRGGCRHQLGSPGVDCFQKYLFNPFFISVCYDMPRKSEENWHLERKYDQIRK